MAWAREFNLPETAKQKAKKQLEETLGPESTNQILSYIDSVDLKSSLDGLGPTEVFENPEVEAIKILANWKTFRLAHIENAEAVLTTPGGWREKSASLIEVSMVHSRPCYV